MSGVECTLVGDITFSTGTSKKEKKTEIQIRKTTCPQIPMANFVEQS